MPKKRTTIYINEKLWKEFLKYLINKYGATHGGLISKEVENAIKMLIEKSRN